MTQEIDAACARKYLLDYCDDAAVEAGESGHSDSVLLQTGLRVARQAIESVPYDVGFKGYSDAVLQALNGAWIGLLTDGVDLTDGFARRLSQSCTHFPLALDHAHSIKPVLITA